MMFLLLILLFCNKLSLLTLINLFCLCYNYCSYCYSCNCAIIFKTQSSHFSHNLIITFLVSLRLYNKQQSIHSYFQFPLSSLRLPLQGQSNFWLIKPVSPRSSDGDKSPLSTRDSGDNSTQRTPQVVYTWTCHDDHQPCCLGVSVRAVFFREQ